jgi:hypothetical protein
MYLHTTTHIVRKATSLQNRANDIRQQQLQQQAITETIVLENSRTKRGDVSDLQELEVVLECFNASMLQTMRVRFQAILELGLELQDILHNVYSLPEGDLATPVKSAANPMTGRKKMKAEYESTSTGPSKPQCSEPHPPTSACTNE